MKKRINLVIGAIIVAFLAFFALYSPEETKNPENSPKETLSEIAIEAPVKLHNWTRNEIDSFELISENGILKFSKENGSWELGTFPSTLFDSQKIFGLTNEIIHLASEEELSEESINKEDWGLAPPQLTLNIFSGKEKREFLLGNKSPGGNGYYLENVIDNTIHLISSSTGDHLLHERNYYLLSKLKTIDPTSFQYAKLTDSGNKTLLEIKSKLKPDMFTADVFSFWLSAPYPYVRPANQEILNRELKKLEDGPVILELFANNESGIPSFGEWERTLTLEDSEGTHVSLPLHKGEEEEILYYFTPEGGNILALDAKSIPFFGQNPFDLVDPFPHLIALNHINQFRISTPQGTLDGNIIRQNDSESFSIQGKKVDRKVFISLYQAILDLQLEGEIPEKSSSGDVLYSIDFRLAGSSDNYTVLYFRAWNDEFLSVARNDETPLFLIGRYQWNDLLKTLSPYF